MIKRTRTTATVGDVLRVLADGADIVTATGAGSVAEGSRRFALVLDAARG